VVTGRWFGGSNERLRDVARVTDLPILKKDFIASERQIVEAKRLGASAVLLTAGILSASALARLIGAALRHDMTPFVEAASGRELAGVVEYSIRVCVPGWTSVSVTVYPSPSAASRNRRLRPLPQSTVFTVECHE
jgi:indole-3-glycerol phosphate synthase